MYGVTDADAASWETVSGVADGRGDEDKAI